jgi:phosphopantothenoylcysteine decarboxylase/phosphopantothenate--cysteine ligase
MDMSDLLNKNILLGVTGGIAAYKAAELCRLLGKHGASVRVVMTAAACEFIRPLTFQALTGKPVLSELFDTEADNAMDHIDLARWADLLLIAPASANTLAKLADGYADNLLTTIALATGAAIAVAPAMNQQMYQNPATLHNIQRLQQRGLRIWGPDEGEQACGEVGPGRMLEPQALLDNVLALYRPGLLAGKRVMITAGPTREPIDPVRYISNRSSGKMGYALAREAIDQGASVTLVSGPVNLAPPQPLNLLSCQTALDMYERVMANIAGQDIFIASAAVADFRVADTAVQKIKQSSKLNHLALTPNPDILASVAALENKPFCVGFAAETDNLDEYAQDKLRRKNLDMIAANRVDQEGSGFDADFNAMTIFWPGGNQQLPRQTKTIIAQQLVAIIARRYNGTS